jgi:carbohydrate diacid regulator
MEGSKVLISHYRPQRLILLSSETKLEEIARKLNQLVSRLRDEPEIETCFVGVGSPVESREGIPASYREAESALRFGNRNRGAILFYEDVEGQALTHAIPDEYKRRLIAKTAPKLSDKMSQTLTCYFECNFNLAAAAEQLGVHRNTLIYRLDKIKQITGYDPQRFRDAFLLQLVLWWKQAEADSSFLDR